MCGIAGIIAPHSSPEWRRRVMTNLLLSAQSRGTDATGIAFTNPQTGKLEILKEGKKATDFVFDKPFTKLAKNFPSVVIGHCRAATKRSETGPENNDNNHPFVGEDAGIAMIHNGLLADDEKWRESFGKPNGIRNKPKSKVDSEVMVKVVETFYLDDARPELHTLTDAIRDACYNIAGAYTLAFIKQDEPNALWLVKHEKELSLAWLPKEKAIVFGSTENIIEEGISEEFMVLDYFTESHTPYHLVNDVQGDSLVKITFDGEEPVIDTLQLKISDKNYTHHRDFFRASAEVGTGAE